MSRAVPPSVILGGRWACESERTTHAHTLSQQLDDVTTHLAAAVHTELSTMSTSLTYMHLSRRFPELASCQLASQASRPVCLCVCVCVCAAVVDFVTAPVTVYLPLITKQAGCSRLGYRGWAAETASVSWCFTGPRLTNASSRRRPPPLIFVRR